MDGFEMRLDRRQLAIFLMVLFGIIQGAYGLQVTVSGGSNGESGSVSMNFDALKTTDVSSQMAISGANIVPTTHINGPIKSFTQTHQVTDNSRKKADVYVKVVNAPLGLDYSSQVLPEEGKLKTIEPWVSAEQWLTVPEADSIKCTATASYGKLSADVGIEEVKSKSGGDYVTLTGYDGKAYVSATQVEASQTATDGSGNSIKIYGHAKDSSGSYSIDTPITSISGLTASFQGLDALSSAGTTTQVTQNEHVIGDFSSKAVADKNSKTRTSNYGTEYDLNMQAIKGSLPTGVLGYYVNPSMATASLGAIQGAVNAAQSSDTINVAAGTYIENVQIDKSLALNGAGAGSTIVDGNQAGSVFTIGMNDPSVDVTLSGMTIQNGYARNGGGIYNNGVATVKRSTISGNTAYWGGGGIYNGQTAKLTVLGGSTISNNQASDGVGGASYGGGIYNTYGGTATITDSTISGNNAYFCGGGFFNRGIVEVTNSEISGNIADAGEGYGGGICNYNIAKVTSSKISGNTAHLDGGGMYNWDATLISENSVISENHAERNGGGIANFAYADWADVTVTGSTIVGNTADLHGGGIWNFANFAEGSVAKVTVTDSTIGGTLPENGNTATSGDGGGIFNQGLHTGMIVEGSTIAQNHADNGGGGGIFNWGNTAVTGSNICWNYAYYGGGISNWGLLVSRDSFGNQIPFDESQVHDNFNGDELVPE
jgi:hypothetical protein